MPRKKLFEEADDDLLDDVEEMEDLDLDLEDEDDLDEGHDPVNAEEHSVDSVDKAAKTGPSARKRKGDKSNSMTRDTVNKGIVRELYDRLNSMSKEDLRAIYSVIMDENFRAEDLLGESDEEMSADYDFTADLDELVKSEATLSEGFKEKSALIMETAIKTKLKEEVTRLEEYYEALLEETVEDLYEDLVEKIDGYLNHVVENWMQENELAISNGLRTEIAEGFMNNLKDLFIESYIEVPEERVNLVDDLSEQVEELEAENNRLVDNMISMKEELEAYKRESIIFEMSSGLADTQIDRLVELSEAIDFDDEDSFRNKIALVKETYFGKKSPSKKSSSLTESFVEDEEDDSVEINEQMQTYVNALNKSKK